MPASSTGALICTACQQEIGGSSIWEGSLPYHPACAPSTIAIDPSGVSPEDAIMAAASVVWEAEKADVIARLSKALGVTGPVTLEGLLQQVEGRLLDWREGRGQE